MIKQIWQGDLSVKMKSMNANRLIYVKRARLIASMINMYRSELKIINNQSQQFFWLKWAAKHGKRLKSSNIFRFKYRSSIEHFAIVEFFIFFIILFCFIFIMQ